MIDDMILVERVVTDLAPHPRNSEFFDDIVGEKWAEFSASIAEYGVREPLLITQHNVIVAGHQRIRGAFENCINVVPCVVREYNSDDDILRDLIWSNIMQRGIISGSKVKMGRMIKELERLEGVQHGGDRKSSCQDDSLITQGELSSSQFANLITQKDLAEKLDISQDTLIRMKKLTELIPEIQDMVDNGLSASTASSVIAKLPEEEQKKLYDILPKDRQVTEKLAKELIAEIQNDSAKKLAGIAESHRIEVQTLAQKLEKQVQKRHELEEQLMRKKEDDELIQEVAEARIKEREWYEKYEQMRKEMQKLQRKLDKTVEVVQDDTEEVPQNNVLSIEEYSAQFSAIKSAMDIQMSDTATISRTMKMLYDDIEVFIQTRKYESSVRDEIELLVSGMLRLNDKLCDLEIEISPVAESFGIHIPDPLEDFSPTLPKELMVANE